jgi:hypothetical protein
MRKYPTDEMVAAALACIDRRVEDARCGDMVRDMLIAADRAAWKPISEAPTDDDNDYLIRWVSPSGIEHLSSMPIYLFDPDETHFRPLPLPPITTADQASTARIETAEVPASPAVVLPTGDAGENPIEQLVALGFRQGAEAMRERVACLYYAGGLTDYASDIRAIPIPEMPEMKR